MKNILQPDGIRLMIDIVPAFVTPIAIGQCEDVDMISAIEKLAYKHLGHKGNVSGHQVEFINNTKSKFNEELSKETILKKFTDFIQPHVNGFADVLNIKTPRKVDLTAAWINVNKPGDYAPEHSHVTSNFSVVFFIKGDENKELGNLVLKSPDVRMEFNDLYLKQSNSNNLNSFGYFYKPKPGRFIIFPAHIKHEVEQNQSDDDRISIAMDYKIYV